MNYFITLIILFFIFPFMVITKFWLWIKDILSNLWKILISTELTYLGRFVLIVLGIIISLQINTCVDKLRTREEINMVKEQKSINELKLLYQVEKNLEGYKEIVTKHSESIESNYIGNDNKFKVNSAFWDLSYLEGISQYKYHTLSDLKLCYDLDIFKTNLLSNKFLIDLRLEVHLSDHPSEDKFKDIKGIDSILLKNFKKFDKEVKILQNQISESREEIIKNLLEWGRDTSGISSYKELQQMQYK